VLAAHPRSVSYQPTIANTTAAPPRRGRDRDPSGWLDRTARRCLVRWVPWLSSRRQGRRV